MASIFRPSYTRQIPKSATRVLSKGKKCVRYKQRGGKIIVAQISETNPSRCVVKGEIYWVKYRDENDEKKFKKGYRDLAATEKLKTDIVTKVERAKANLLPCSILAIEPNSILIEAERFASEIENQGATKKHSQLQYRTIKRIIETLDWKNASDIQSEQLTKYLKDRMGKDRKENGISSTTANNYLTAIKSLTRWLYRTNRLLSDPLKSLSKYVDSQNHRRRALQPSDFVRFIERTRSNRVLKGLTGEERSILYSLAARTGLRASELSSLSVSSLVLDSKTPIVICEFQETKNDTEANLPLSSKIVPILKEYTKDKQPTAKLFPDRTGTVSPWWTVASKMVQHDLKQACVPYRDDRGDVYDFHALRTQFVSDLVRAGVPLAKVQKLARHSSPLLTTKHYTRIELEDLANSVELLS